MSHTLVKNYIHIVFSTKNRIPLIDQNIESDLFEYLGGICNGLECSPIIIGGFRDHVHILCSLSKKVALMDLVEVIKSHSSKWIKTKGSSYRNFYWQAGYGTFSVNPADMLRLVKYIANQRAHHTKKTFKVEYVKILEKNAVKYDERFLWD